MKAIFKIRRQLLTFRVPPSVEASASMMLRALDQVVGVT